MPAPHGRAALMLETATMDALLTVAQVVQQFGPDLHQPEETRSPDIRIMDKQLFSSLRQSFD
jgi:hypothetical protein